MSILDEERRNKNVQKENERFTIETRTVNEKYINKAGNISDGTYQTKYVALDGVVVTNDYMYLKKIDEDTFIFGKLVVNPGDYNLTCKEDFNDDIAAKIKYGILKLKRRLLIGELVIDSLKEEIIVPAVYDKIEPNKDKVVTVFGNNSKSYFDCERREQLLPLMLKEAGKFGDIYDGFAKCLINGEKEFGYIPQNMNSVRIKKDVKLLTEKQIEILIKYQENIDEIMEANNIYVELTGEKFNKIKNRK